MTLSLPSLGVFHVFSTLTRSPGDTFCRNSSCGWFIEIFVRGGLCRFFFWSHRPLPSRSVYVVIAHSSVFLTISPRTAPPCSTLFRLLLVYPTIISNLKFFVGDLTEIVQLLLNMDKIYRKGVLPHFPTHILHWLLVSLLRLSLLTTLCHCVIYYKPPWQSKNGMKFRFRYLVIYNFIKLFLLV